MSAPTGVATGADEGTRSLLLGWLDRPRADRGVRFAAEGDEWQERSYAELAADAQLARETLADAGVRPGQVVSLLIADQRHFVAALFGTWLAGCTASPIASPLTFRSVDSYVEHVSGVLAVARPGALLCDGGLAPLVAGAAERGLVPCPVVRLELGDGAGGTGAPPAPAAPPAELALLQFTSGSSGRPKGVRVTHANLDHNLRSIHRWLDWSERDSLATWLPTYHDMGLVGTLLCPVTYGSDLWLLTPDVFLRSPRRWLDCFGRSGATITSSPSFGYAYADRRVPDDALEGADFSAWRVAIVAAERIDPGALARFTARLRPHGFDPRAFVPAYGLAEATLAVTGVPPSVHARTVKVDPQSLRPGAPVTVVERGLLGDDGVPGPGWLTDCGRPVWRTDLRVVDDEGVELPAGHCGEIVVRSPSVALGYEPAGAAGSSRFDGAALHTGDSGFVLDGELYVVGRLGDALKVRGRTVYAEEVEAAVGRLPGLHPGRCVAVLGSTGGREVAAVAVEDDDPAAAWAGGVRTVVRGLTGPDVRLVLLRAPRGAIPRTSSGKPRRRIVWRLLAEDGLDWITVEEPGAGVPT